MPTVEPTTARQRILYLHTCDIWKPDAVTLAADGRPNNVTSYTRIAEGQKCYFFRKKSSAEPSFVGRVEQDIMFTQDVCHFPDTVDVSDTYVLKRTDAIATRLENTFWRVMGEAQAIGAVGNRQAAYGEVYLRKLRAAPSGVS
jgi:hypothetical protein